jgi:hypothetical protein
MAVWEKIMLDEIYGISWTLSSTSPVILVQLWRKFLPDLEELYLQGFPNEKISKYEILDLVCAVRGSENVYKNSE